MLALLLAGVLGQVPLIPSAGEEVPEPVVPESLAARQQKEREAEGKVTQRVLLSGGAAVLGAGAGMGIALAFSLPNPTFDGRFATAGLCTLLVTGGAFLVHQALGGHGEVMLGLLGSIIGMVAGAFSANAIEPTVPGVLLLTAAIGALPAAALAVLGLEVTSTGLSPVRVVAAGPTGLVVAF